MSSLECVFPISNFKWSIQRPKCLSSPVVLTIARPQRTSLGTSFKDSIGHQRTSNGNSSLRSINWTTFASSVNSFSLSVHSSNTTRDFFQEGTRVISPHWATCSSSILRSVIGVFKWFIPFRRRSRRVRWTSRWMNRPRMARVRSFHSMDRHRHRLSSRFRVHSGPIKMESKIILS